MNGKTKAFLKKYFIIEAAVFAAVILADQITKAVFKNALAGGKVVNIFGEFLTLDYYTNYGAAFGSMNGANILFFFVTLLGCAIFVFLFWYQRGEPLYTRIALALMAGGALGNAIDRAVNASNGFFNGYVRDFISVKYFAVFNVADSALTVGAAIFAAAFIFFDKRNKKSKDNGSKENDGNGSAGE